MLDYSDEESPRHSFRRRTHSQSEETKNSPMGYSVHLRRGEQPCRNEGISFSTLASRTGSIFRGFKNRSSGVIMPTTSQPPTNPFTINQFIVEESTGSKSGLLNFEKNIKSDGSLLNSPTINKFSPDFEDHPDSFFMSMKTIVILAQFFAVLPLTGVGGPNYLSLRFKWIHVRTAYWAFSFFGSLFLLMCAVNYGLQHGVFTQAASAIVFFTCGVATLLLMLNLSRNWKKLNEEFADVENKLRKYGYPKNIGFKFKLTTILFLLTALDSRLLKYQPENYSNKITQIVSNHNQWKDVQMWQLIRSEGAIVISNFIYTLSQVEHLLSKVTGISKAMACARRKDDFLSLSESFFMNQYSEEIFSITSYSLWKGILILLVHFLATAVWNFTDLFMSLISWTIAERFKQIHDFLDRVHGQEKPISFWKEVREDYNDLSVLTKRVDSHIRTLMLISMGNNLFFICLQLLQSLRNKLAPIRLLYFFWSFGFLVLRTSFVAFSAARINDESKEPKTVLYSVPYKNYSAEVRRFLTQLTTNDVALTGCGFFSITRSLMLTITGTVITYEIVLVQFSADDNGDELKNNQTMCLNH